MGLLLFFSKTVESKDNLDMYPFEDTSSDTVALEVLVFIGLKDAGNE